MIALLRCSTAGSPQKSKGLRLAWSQVGAGDPVVYLHGALTTLEEGMIGLGAALSPRFQLTAFDRPGHGESSKDLTTGSVWRQAELIVAAMADMGIKRPVVVGHSFGGAVAMAMALQSPQAISGVVALAPIAFPEPRPELALFGTRAFPISGAVFSRASRLVDTALLPALWRGMFLPQPMPGGFQAGFPFGLAGGASQVRADGQEALQMVAGLLRASALYDGCQVPVHVLQGDRDLVVNPALHGRPLAALLPHGRFTWLPGLGHMAHHFAPEVVADAIAAINSSTSLCGAKPTQCG